MAYYSTLTKFPRLPRLYTYADAAAHEAAVKPMNKSSNRYAGKKPLGSRKHAYLNIERDDEGVIRITRSYRRDHPTILEYWPNGEICLYGGVAEAERDVIAWIMGTVITISDSRMWVRATAPGEDGGDVADGFWLVRGYGPNETHRPEQDTLHKPYSTFRRESYGVLRYVDPLYPIKHRVDRKKMNALRKKFSEFRTYAHGMIKLMGEGSILLPEQLEAAWGQITPPPFDSAKMLANIGSGDPGLWASTVAYLVYIEQCDKWARNRVWSVATFEKGFTNTLMITHGEQVLKPVEVRTGRIVDDPNRIYVR